MAIQSIDYKRCISCGNCDRACPMDVIRFDPEQKKPYILFPEDCQSCFLCLIQCPLSCIIITSDRAQKIPESITISR